MSDPDILPYAQIQTLLTKTYRSISKSAVKKEIIRLMALIVLAAKRGRCNVVSNCIQDDTVRKAVIEAFVAQGYDARQREPHPTAKSEQKILAIKQQVIVIMKPIQTELFLNSDELLVE
jgi:hypothetical protein